MTEMQSPEQLLEVARGFWEARIILTAAELRLFDQLETESKSAHEMAAAIGLDPRAAEILLNAIVAMGLLEKSRGLYSNSPLARRCLLSDAPASVLAPLGHYNNLWETWSQLTQVVRSGQPAPRSFGEASLEDFILAMHRFSADRVGAVVAAVDLTGVSNLLDLGGGSGTYACGFLRSKADLRATVFDFPGVLAITRRVAEESGCADRLAVLPGDATCDSLGSGYDLVFISAVIHSLAPEEVRLVFRKVHEALNHGGQIVVRDWLMNEAKTEPAAGAIFAVNMLVGTPGASYSEAEVRTWLEDAGFTNLRRLDPEPTAAIMIARKI